MADSIIRAFTLAEHSTVLAALRYYQSKGMGEPFNRPDDIHEIATCGGDLMSSLDDAGIDELCEEFNLGPPPATHSAPLADAIETVLAAIAGSSREGDLGAACNTLEDFAVNHCGDDSDDPRAPAAIVLLQELVAYQAEQFDGPPDEDLDVSGADTVDWLSEFRGRAKAVLAGAPAPEPSLSEAIAVARDLHKTECCASNLPFFDRFITVLKRMEAKAPDVEARNALGLTLGLITKHGLAVELARSHPEDFARLEAARAVDRALRAPATKAEG